VHIPSSFLIFPYLQPINTPIEEIEEADLALEATAEKADMTEVIEKTETEIVEVTEGETREDLDLAKESKEDPLSTLLRREHQALEVNLGNRKIFE
jgi:hypothetical protein